MARVEPDVLRAYEAKGLIKRQRGPDDLIIWNYTRECQYSGAWDDITRMCRGLITDAEGTIVARPFRKFFNLGEPNADPIPGGESPRVYEKLDGSLGILYFDAQGAPRIATRGSFVSEQAKWATEWIQSWAYENCHFNRAYTYLFEIIYPANRVVVDYGKRAECVLIGVVETETGAELDPRAEALRLGLVAPFVYDWRTREELEEIARRLPANAEGFVLHWPESGVRLKVKGAEYLRLHKARFGLSNRSVWEALAAGRSTYGLGFDTDSKLWVFLQAAVLGVEYKGIEECVAFAYKGALAHATRKDAAMWLREAFPDVAAEVFAVMDDKDYKAIIWKKVYPKEVEFYAPSGGSDG